MTFREAATLARDAEVGEMWLTHYSPSLVDPFYMISGGDLRYNTSVQFMDLDL